MKYQGKLKEAESSIRKSILINPDFAQAYLNLAIILKDLGRPQEAFDSYLKVIDIDPYFSNIYALINSFIGNTDPSHLNKSSLKTIVNILLERDDISHSGLVNAFKLLYRNEIINNLQDFDLDSSKNKSILKNRLLNNGLKKIIFRDKELDKSLTKVRKNICNCIAKDINNINESDLQFIIALGEQCFLNEYIYFFSEEENININKIIKRCKDGKLSEKYIVILSCYYPLYKLLDKIPSLKSFTSSNQILKELITLQITEPLTEI